MDTKNVDKAKLIPGQQKIVKIMAPNRKGCRALAMPWRQIWVDRIILRDQRVRPDPHLVSCVVTCRRPPGRPRSARIGNFDIPDGQTNAGAA